MAKIAVIIPCHNEEKTIGKVISDFRKYLPNAEIYVCDNASTDKTAENAAKYGAKVLTEPQKGKGNAVRRLFRSVEADYYFMCDGDITYDASSSKKMLETMLRESLDMVVASRSREDEKNSKKSNYSENNKFSNKLLTKLIKMIFNYKFEDVFSGFRLFNKRFVKTFPNNSKGFEIESEICIHTASLQIPYKEINSRYFSRPDNSQSNPKTFRDKILILRNIITLIKEYKPFQLFSFFALIFAVASFLVGLPSIIEFINTGVFKRFPETLFSITLGFSALILVICGIILDSIATEKRERLLLNYLGFNQSKK